MNRKEIIQLINKLDKEALARLAAQGEELSVEDFISDNETKLRDRVLRHVVEKRISIGDVKKMA